MTNHQTSSLPEAEFAFLCLDSFCLVDCAPVCFLRVELEPVNEQKKTLNALENNVETTLSDVPNQLAKKTSGTFVFNLV